jgi:tRNA-specific 2-thiouridylase
MNWINKQIPKNNNVYLRFRHRQELIKGSFKIENRKVILNYGKTLSVTPGQYAVLYQKNICLGGGEIEKILK